MRKKPFKRLSISFGLFGVAALLILWLVVSEPKPDTRPPDAQPESVPFGQMEDLVYIRTVSGEPQGQINAKHADYYNDRAYMDFEHVDGRFYDQSRTLATNSERGSMDLNTSRGVLTGNVLCRTDDGVLLHTPRLEFDSKAKQLHTDQAVLFEGPNYTVQGIGADADITIQKFQIHQQVEATLWQAATAH
jgi:LPS export ABC transporter protein LptC